MRPSLALAAVAAPVGRGRRHPHRAWPPRLIAELEQHGPGRYAGPVGWMDATGDGAWGIALRSGAFAPDDGRQITLYAGCGIVAGSDPQAELAESNAKLIPMRDALASD